MTLKIHYYILQVKNSRNTSSNSKPPIRGGPARDKEETSDDDTSTAGTITTDTTLVDANIKDYQVTNDLELHYN